MSTRKSRDESQNHIISMNNQRAGSDIAFSTRALTALTQNVVKILMHLDGTHSVHRQYCSAEKVLERAAERQFILLDLGHVLRLYFGDDYFDLHLDVSVPYIRSDKMTQLVVDVVAENKLNERRMELVVPE